MLKGQKYKPLRSLPFPRKLRLQQAFTLQATSRTQSPPDIIILNANKITEKFIKKNLNIVVDLFTYKLTI